MVSRWRGFGHAAERREELAVILRGWKSIAKALDLDASVHFRGVRAELDRLGVLPDRDRRGRPVLVLAVLERAVARRVKVVARNGDKVA